jgi:triosephosphate isomerase
MSKKIAKALIGGNWKCNGTVAQIKSMVDVLNKAGPFSANSEVFILLIYYIIYYYYYYRLLLLYHQFI